MDQSGFNKDMNTYIKEKKGKFQLRLPSFFRRNKKEEADIPQEQVTALLDKKPMPEQVTSVDVRTVSGTDDDLKDLVKRELSEIQHVEQDIISLKKIIIHLADHSVTKQVREQELKEKEKHLEKLLEQKQQQLDTERMKLVEEKKERVADKHKGYKRKLRLLHTRDMLKEKVKSLNNALKGIIKRQSGSKDVRLVESLKKIVRIQEQLLEKAPSSLIAKFTKSNDFPLYLKLIEKSKDELISTRFLERIRKREEQFKQVHNVKTGVDEFVELIKRKKKISVTDAAKELGVPREIIEEWTDLLEQEGTIKAHYTFTQEMLEEQ